MGGRRRSHPDAIPALTFGRRLKLRPGPFVLAQGYMVESVDQVNLRIRTNHAIEVFALAKRRRHDGAEACTFADVETRVVNDGQREREFIEVVYRFGDLGRGLEIDNYEAAVTPFADEADRIEKVPIPDQRC